METTQLKEPVILIVDDNPENLQVLGKLLKENKYTVEFAVDGESALGWLTKKSFDLILLDINMPGMNGFEVCKKIRSNPVMNNLPVIFLTAENDRESILMGFETGGQDYITKPFDIRELIVRVKTHLSLKFSREKLETINQYLEEKVNERTQQLRDANVQLENSNQKLADLDKAKNDFLNLISHEIRTPLNGIMGPLQLIKESFNSSEIVELLEMLDSSVSRLEKFSTLALLITNLKTKGEILKDRIDLGNLINEVITEADDNLKAKNLQMHLTIQPDNITFPGAQNLIRTCLTNILENAIRFSPNNSSIEIRCTVDEKFITCEVQDHGNGFSRKVIEHPFELFVTGDEYADNQIGLDLPLVKMIMNTLGGQTTLFNAPAGGAVVRLEFIKD